MIGTINQTFLSNGLDLPSYSLRIKGYWMIDSLFHLRILSANK